MKILVAGAGGQLGWEVLQAAKERGVLCKGLDNPPFDITDQSSVEEALAGERFTLVVNASGYTEVDQAESESDLAFSVNSTGPGYLAQACARRDIPLLHVSTDYVFDGLKKTPYVETDPVCPINVYGESKAGGEALVRSSLVKHIILRTSWLYSTCGKNFVKSIIRLATEKEELQVVDDQYGCPTSANDFAEVILRLAEVVHERAFIDWGTYHYCGQGVVSRHGFAKKIHEIAGSYVSLKAKHVRAISTLQFPTPARRPPCTALDCTKIRTVFGISARPWESSLAQTIAGMFRCE